MHIRDLDLNLLRVFDAVYQQRSVSRAAEVLGLSQPAVSHGITRLRLLIGDALFVRVAGGVRPTAKADALAAAVQQALHLVEEALHATGGFDPGRARKIFRMHMSDIGEGVFLPALMHAVRRQAPGVFAWLPLGLRVKARIETIIREEMTAAGAQEVHFPALLPREPYEATGRWTEYGPNIFRLRDRKGNDYLLAPTHEEMFTLLVKDLYSSYKDLPVTLYQIQTKYRDEARPRAGLIRGREFVMKDAYSFDVDDDGLKKAYDAHREAYQRIFDRLKVRYVIVSAVSGAMGGSASEEFLAESEVGEDTYVRCPQSGYAANVEAVVTTAALLIDAQAQLTHAASAGSSGNHHGSVAPTSATPRAEVSMDALARLVDVAAEAADALANDDFVAYQKIFPRLESASASLPLPALELGTSLKTARRSFEPWSTAVADLVKPHRAHLSVKVFQCPMTPVLGHGRWVQRNQPLKNPFFGSTMPDCGEEVR